MFNAKFIYDENCGKKEVMKDAKSLSQQSKTTNRSVSAYEQALGYIMHA